MIFLKQAKLTHVKSSSPEIVALATPERERGEFLSQTAGMGTLWNPGLPSYSIIITIKSTKNFKVYDSFLGF